MSRQRSWCCPIRSLVPTTRNSVARCRARTPRGQVLRRRAADQGGQAGQGLRADPVVDPHAALVPAPPAGLVQHLHVVADRRLGQVEGRVQVADAGLAALVGGDQGTSRSRTGSARAFSSGATRSACSMVSGCEVSGEQQAAVSAGLTMVRELDTHLY